MNLLKKKKDKKTNVVHIESLDQSLKHSSKLQKVNRVLDLKKVIE